MVGRSAEWHLNQARVRKLVDVFIFQNKFKEHFAKYGVQIRRLFFKNKSIEQVCYIFLSE